MKLLLLFESAQFLSDPTTFTVENIVKLHYNFSCDLALLQTQLLDLQSDDTFQKSQSLFTTWDRVQGTELRKMAAKLLSIFTSTYNCETTFSALNNIKSKLRTRLTDENLKNCIVSSLTNNSVNLLDLVKEK